MSNSRSTMPPPPPPQDGESAPVVLTPEQTRTIELNRLRAKARQREREQPVASSSSSSSTLNANGKRPLAVVPASSTSPTAPRPARPLKRDARLGKYFEYDLSKMVNSKGGFLVDDEKEVDEDLRARERERERERALQSIEPPISLDSEKNPKCADCGSMDIDHTFRKVFRCWVCNKCKNNNPERYSLLTKTECKEDYLLTDGEKVILTYWKGAYNGLNAFSLAELRDSDLMPHLLKANPHKSTYNNMMLFLRFQVEEFAWTKWGSPEALDVEFERRTAEKKKKKKKKFEEGLKELRRRTRESRWQRRQDEEHKHVFGVVEKGNDGTGRQVCHECGFTIEVEEF